MGNYLKINSKYINDFKNNIRTGVLSLVRTSDSTVLKIIIREVNKLFKIMSGKLTTKKQIPKPSDFPDSKLYNSFIDNINIDLDKIYTAQSIIEDDVQNVTNFNSLEREKAIRNLT